MIYSFVSSISDIYRIKDLCDALGVSKSSYYSYLGGKSYKLSPSKIKKSNAVKTVFERHKGRYGSRRIQSELVDEGHKIGIYQVRSMMRQQNLEALRPSSR